LGKGGEAIKGWLAPPLNRIFFLLIFLRKINRIEMTVGRLVPPLNRIFFLLIFLRKINRIEMTVGRLVPPHSRELSFSSLIFLRKMISWIKR